MGHDERFRSRLIRTLVVSAGLAAILAAHGLSLAAYGVGLYYAMRHGMAPGAVLGGAAVVILIKHLELLGAFSAWLRRRLGAKRGAGRPLD